MSVFIVTLTLLVVISTRFGKIPVNFNRGYSSYLLRFKWYNLVLQEILRAFCIRLDVKHASSNRNNIGCNDKQ